MEDEKRTWNCLECGHKNPFLPAKAYKRGALRTKCIRCDVYHFVSLHGVELAERPTLKWAGMHN